MKNIILILLLTWAQYSFGKSAICTYNHIKKFYIPLPREGSFETTFKDEGVSHTIFIKNVNQFSSIDDYYLISKKYSMTYALECSYLNSSSN